MRGDAHPVGTGPHKVAEFKSGQSILLVAHDQYWGGPPPAASVKFQIVPEIAARMAGLSAGDYDLITEVPPDQFDTIDGYRDLQVVGGPILNHLVLLYDKFNPQLADVHVQQIASCCLASRPIPRSSPTAAAFVSAALSRNRYAQS